MRTNINIVETNRNVIGLGQDRVVSSLDVTCADAAQHLDSRHASKHAHGLARALKRRGFGTAATAGAALLAKRMRLAITGPQWQAVRLVSPSVVMS
jgi:cysteine synthase